MERQERGGKGRGMERRGMKEREGRGRDEKGRGIKRRGMKEGEGEGNEEERNEGMIR